MKIQLIKYIKLCKEKYFILKIENIFLIILRYKKKFFGIKYELSSIRTNKYNIHTLLDIEDS